MPHHRHQSYHPLRPPGSVHRAPLCHCESGKAGSSAVSHVLSCNLFQDGIISLIDFIIHYLNLPPLPRFFSCFFLRLLSVVLIFLLCLLFLLFVSLFIICCLPPLSPFFPVSFSVYYLLSESSLFVSFSSCLFPCSTLYMNPISHT